MAMTRFPLRILLLSLLCAAIANLFSIVAYSNNGQIVFSESSFTSPSTSKLRRVWACRNPPNGTKVVFVHVFKTAGSSIRQFMANYAKECNASYATIVGCTSVKRTSFKVDNKAWSPCALKHTVDRKGVFEFHYNGTVNNTLVNDIDMVAGHLRLGSFDHLGQEVMHFSFFRNAAEKFVSGRVFTKMLNKGVSKEETIRLIRKQVESGAQKGEFHTKYSQYLLTPAQRDHLRRNTTREIAQVMKQNLLDYNVIVGMVDRMSESMQILRHVLGGEDEPHLDSLFAWYSGKNSKGRDVVNKSPVSASAVLAELQQDEEFYEKLLEYVKYEQEVTDFAREIHMRQYQAITIA